VVLLSGGLDSATVLAIARGAGFECHALTADYGQRHRIEIDRATRLAAALGAASHRVVAVDLAFAGGSALTDPAVAVPKGRGVDDIDSGTIPVTYVPARNTVLLSLALSWAEVLQASDLYLGVNAVDYSGYPDCRPAFLDAFARLADVATRAGVEGGDSFRVHAPLLALDKADIVRRAVALGVDLSLTTTCYDPRPDGAPCRQCDACVLRARGFEGAGIDDPTIAD
jgi:7-cyano-7-deazaguanine synthase